MEDTEMECQVNRFLSVETGFVAAEGWREIENVKLQNHQRVAAENGNPTS